LKWINLVVGSPPNNGGGIMSTLTEAKQQIWENESISILEIERLAIKSKKEKGKYTCVHGCNSSDGLSIWRDPKDGKYKAKCFSCNKIDTIIGVVSKTNNIGFNQAIKEIANRHGILIEKVEYTAEQKKEYAQKKSQLKTREKAITSINEDLAILYKKDNLEEEERERAFHLEMEKSRIETGETNIQHPIKIYGNYEYHKNIDTLQFFYFKENKETKEKEKHYIPIYDGNLKILENSIHLDTDTEMILLSSKMNNKEATKLIPKGLLSTKKLVDELNNKRGFFIKPNGKIQGMIQEYLYEQYMGLNRDDLLQETLYTNKIGWYENFTNGYDISTFVYPNNDINIGSLVSYDKDGEYNRVFTTKGTVEQWTHEVLIPSLESDNIKIMLLASISSIFIKPLGIHENFVLDLSGTTGTGKTTAEKVCASIFGNPTKYMSDWNATENSIISKAVELSCFPLMMDDTKKCTTKDMIPSVIYSISGGKSKGRSNVDGTLRQQKEFTNIMITTGEVPITNYLQGSETGRGAFARVITLEGGAFKKNDENKIKADDLNNATSEYYGTFAVDFMKWLNKQIDDEKIDEWKAEYYYLREKNSDKVVEELSKRKANHISLLELTAKRLKEYFADDLFKVDKLIENLLTVTETSSIEADNIKEAYRAIIEYCTANHNRFYGTDTVEIEGVVFNEKINSPIGQYKIDLKTDDRAYCFYQKEVVEDVIRKYGDTTDIWRGFKERNYIECNKGARGYSKTVKKISGDKKPAKMYYFNVLDI